MVIFFSFFDTLFSLHVSVSSRFYFLSHVTFCLLVLGALLRCLVIFSYLKVED